MKFIGTLVNKLLILFSTDYRLVDRTMLVLEGPELINDVKAHIHDINYQLHYHNYQSRCHMNDVWIVYWTLSPGTELYVSCVNWLQSYFTDIWHGSTLVVQYLVIFFFLFLFSATLVPVLAYGSREWAELTNYVCLTDLTCASLNINGGMWLTLCGINLNRVAWSYSFNHIPALIF